VVEGRRLSRVLLGGQAEATVARWNVPVADPSQVAVGARPDRDDEGLRSLLRHLAALASGAPAELTGGWPSEIDVDVNGTPFQAQVWAALREIPRGQTRSYAEVARAIERPTAARAVAAACGANPVPLVVPCHRVIASDGSLGGFSAGIAVKSALLAAEGVSVR